MPDKVTISQFATNQIAEMAKDPSIDAFMAVGPLNSKITADAITATATARGEPKFLPIDVSEAIAQKHPLYESEEIAGSIFSSSPARPDDKVETVSVNHLIVAAKSVSETSIAGFARQLFTVRQQLARELPSAAHIEKPDTDKDAALPAHAGAAAYIDGTERTFLEKYTDYIWGAILILSGLGSAGAWLQHYWKRDEREQYTAHRDNLLDLISKVRKAETPEELADMQTAADGMLREALDCYDDGAIEEGDLSVIGLTLEQFHHAVADRRATIAMARLTCREGGRERVKAFSSEVDTGSRKENAPNKEWSPVLIQSEPGFRLSTRLISADWTRSQNPNARPARTPRKTPAPGAISPKFRNDLPDGRRRGLRPAPARPAGDEAVMKQNLNAMKPFWRFCANVLKRLICTGFAQRRAGTSATGRKLRGRPMFNSFRMNTCLAAALAIGTVRIFHFRHRSPAAAVSVLPGAADRSRSAAGRGSAAG